MARPPHGPRPISLLYPPALSPRPSALNPRPAVPLGPAGLTLVAAAMLGLAAGGLATGASLSPLTWYLARAAGFTLYLLLWLAVVTGLGMTTKLLGFVGRDGQHWQLHRLTTELSIVALALHVLALAFDPTVPLGMLGVLLPFTSDLRQPWTDLGVIAGYGLVGVASSYGLRRWLGWRGWRLLHYAAFPLWLVGLLHGLGAGSDSGQLWAVALYGGTAAVVVYLGLYRLMRAGRRARNAPLPPSLRDRTATRRRIEELRETCAYWSLKTKSNSRR